MDQYAGAVVCTHVFSAIVWLGSAIGFHGFVEPRTENAGTTGDHQLITVLSGPFTPVITVASLLTIASGSILYAHLAVISGVHAFITGTGIGYSLGSGATLMALCIAMTVTGPSTLELIRLGRALDRSAWELTPAQATVLAAARRRLAVGGRIATALLGVAILAMCLVR